MADNEKEIILRWAKKKEKIRQLNDNVTRLRHNVSLDLKSENEKTSLTALVVSIMMATSERVGNSFSASQGHYGVTGLKKNHIKINGNTITFQYTGKSGVEHDKQISNERIATYLEKAIKNSSSNNVFETSEGFKISNDRVNRYLRDFEISAKDLRGHFANELILKRLNSIDIIEDTEYKRKRQLTTHMKYVAGKLGHGAGTLRKHYVLPEIIDTFIIDGKVFDIEKLPVYKEGGKILAPSIPPQSISVDKNPKSAFSLLFFWD